ncbi:MAG: ABC transporter permease, partial [SAR202 cluster bacterium]|nr:ABC transporter permease [SAR202 cluster bacterium]
RLTRSSMIDVMQQDFVQTALAKGLPKGLVLRRHDLIAGQVPLITMMGLQFAFMMGGAIVVENIFSWNGVGRMAVEAIFQREYPIIQGFILTFAVVVVIVSIFLDTIYAFIDPRIRRG